MNKQELIERYKTKYAEEPKDWKHPSVNASRQDLFANFIRDLEQLNEPQKPVVPKFVADWFEENKDDLDNAIFGYLVFWEERDTDSILYQWFAKSENKPIETIIRMKDGYEVKKEPLWGIKNAEGNYLTKCALWGKDGVNYSFECNPSHQLLFTDKAVADAAALLVKGTVEEV